jgi:hypothetical protein
MNIPTVCVIAALGFSATASAFAADAGGAFVSRDFTDSVAPPDQQAYEAGVMAFNQCLRDHGSKYAWTAWVHETGDVYSYSYVVGPYAWADFDAMREVGKACDATWRTRGNPHLRSETSTFMVDQPAMSHMAPDWNKQAPSPLIDVVYFTLKETHAAHEVFIAAMKKIAVAADNAKWPYYFRFFQIQAGGEGAPDYVLVMPGKNWADYGAATNASLWKMIEGAYGKADADALRKSINDTLDKSSEHVDSYNADLSYIPRK